MCAEFGCWAAGTARSAALQLGLWIGMCVDGVEGAWI